MAGAGTLKWLVGATGALAALCCAGPAGAVVQSGITYHDDSGTILGGGSGTGAGFPCLTEGEVPLASAVVHNGGADVFLTELGVDDSSPVDGVFDSGFFTSRNTNPIDKTYNQYVICDETAPKYVEESAPAPYQSRTKVTAYCSRKRHVYSGSITAGANFDDVYLASSYPVDSRNDKDKKPDDGWRFSADSTNVDETPELDVMAHCGKEKPAYVKSEPVEIPGAGVLDQGATCTAPKGQVIGGGAKLPSAYGVARTSSSYIYNASPAYDSWGATAYSSALTEAKMTVFAVCVADLL